MVWVSAPYQLRTCPVLALTPDVCELEGWFARTHQVVDGVWRLVRLPIAGGTGAQDARLMAGLDIARDAANAVLRAARASLAPRTPPATPSAEPVLEDFPTAPEAPADGQ